MDEAEFGDTPEAVLQPSQRVGGGGFRSKRTAAERAAAEVKRAPPAAAAATGKRKKAKKAKQGKEASSAGSKQPRPAVIPAAAPVQASAAAVVPPSPEAKAKLKGKRLYIVFVGNLSFSTTAEALQHHFKACGQCTVRLLTKKGTLEPRGCAFVEFTSASSHEVRRSPSAPAPGPLAHAKPQDAIARCCRRRSSTTSRSSRAERSTLNPRQAVAARYAKVIGQPQPCPFPPSPRT
jgi:hypothetical protein